MRPIHGKASEGVIAPRRFDIKALWRYDAMTPEGQTVAKEVRDFQVQLQVSSEIYRNGAMALQRHARIGVIVFDSTA